LFKAAIGLKGPLTDVYISVDGGVLSTGAEKPSADVELPPEAFARLVYGRLDLAHTPLGGHDLVLRRLRDVFPGP
jgi:hypothetical protein